MNLIRIFLLCIGCVILSEGLLASGYEKETQKQHRLLQKKQDKSQKVTYKYGNSGQKSRRQGREPRQNADFEQFHRLVRQIEEGDAEVDESAEEILKQQVFIEIYQPNLLNLIKMALEDSKGMGIAYLRRKYAQMHKEIRKDLSEAQQIELREKKKNRKCATKAGRSYQRERLHTQIESLLLYHE